MLSHPQSVLTPPSHPQRFFQLSLSTVATTQAGTSIRNWMIWHVVRYFFHQTLIPRVASCVFCGGSVCAGDASMRADALRGGAKKAVA